MFNRRGGGGGGGSRGGGGGNRRTSYPPQQQQQRGGPHSRLSMGGGPPPPPRRHESQPQPAAAAAGVEESFRLVGGNSHPSPFAAIIRLAPDLVDEIKRVESQGGGAKINFDHNPNNSLGNVIDVGGKEFRFTWSHETGGLCDIYEERQKGEDGNGLLVESGCAWRKLNVQRVLDESTKNHVKMRSEEAERKLKSRKAIVLDPCNPATKSQTKALVAAEASPWKSKQNQFKKRNFEPPQAGGPSKAVHKSGFPTKSTVKGRRSTSPQPSPQKQSVASASPSVRRNVTESQVITEEISSLQARTKKNATALDCTAPASGRTQGAVAGPDNQVMRNLGLENSLITLLKENPKGMSVKALEKAVGDPLNSARKIEPILQKIAIYEATGRYILKPQMELQSSKPLSLDGGSSPEDNHQLQNAPEDVQEQAPELGFPGDLYGEDTSEQAPFNGSLVEKIDTSQHFTELFGDDEPPDISEGHAASSSNSGSDSDSDSRSSDSDSDSRSRSRSPARAASGSGSDGEKDASSNSKEGSDVDIDIIDDDDKEPNQLFNNEHELSTAPTSWSLPEARPGPDGNAGDQDGYASEDIDIDIDIDIEKDFLADNEAELARSVSDNATTTEKSKPLSPYCDQYQLYNNTDRQIDREHVDDEFKHEHSLSSVKAKGKSKRNSNMNQVEENAGHAKRRKAGHMAQPSISGNATGHPSKPSPDMRNEDHGNRNMRIQGQFTRDDIANIGNRRGHGSHVSEKSMGESLHSSQMPPVRSQGIEVDDRYVKNPPNRERDINYPEMNVHARESILKQGDKSRREAHDRESGLTDKASGRFKDNLFDKKHQFAYSELQQKKHSEEGKKALMVENSSRQASMGTLPKESANNALDKSSDRKVLRREPSDLELGELREPLTEETDVSKKQFKRVGSFKQSDVKLSSSDARIDLKAKPVSKSIMDSGFPSSPNTRPGVTKNSDNLSKRRSPEPYAEESNRPSHRAVQLQQQQSKAPHSEIGSLSNKGSELDSVKGALHEVSNQGTNVEGYGETQKKSNLSSHLDDSDLGSRKVKGNKSRKSNSSADGGNRKKDVEDRKEKRKRSGSSSEEDNLYSKYEKEEPELKGPIKSFSQYKEYMQEYYEKYEAYCSLNKILEEYRNQFQKLGMDLDGAKGRDMDKYYSILAQLRDSYRQCAPRHKRLKKIFVVLHQELRHIKQMMMDFAADNTRD